MNNKQGQEIYSLTFPELVRQGINPESIKRAEQLFPEEVQENETLGKTYSNRIKGLTTTYSKKSLPQIGLANKGKTTLFLDFVLGFLDEQGYEDLQGKEDYIIVAEAEYALQSWLDRAKNPEIGNNGAISSDDLYKNNIFYNKLPLNPKKTRTFRRQEVIRELEEKLQITTDILKKHAMRVSKKRQHKRWYSLIKASPEQVEHWWARYRADEDEDARNKLVEHYLPLVRHYANKFSSSKNLNLDSDDLVSAGIFGLIDSLNKYDPNRGVKFESFCSRRVNGAMLDSLREMDWASRRLRRKSHMLEKATQQYKTEHGHSPSEKEVAGIMGLSLKSFRKLESSVQAVKISSLSEPTNENREENKTTFLGDDLVDNKSPDPQREAEQRDLIQTAMRTLNKNQRNILISYYYEDMTMREIGETRGLSESRISQIYTEAIKILSDEMRIKANDSEEKPI